MKNIGEIGWIEKDKPNLGPNDAILKPIAVAPCTSDEHIVWEGISGERHNVIFGQEAIGLIDEVGSEVKDFKAGDKVIVPTMTPNWTSQSVQRGFQEQAAGAYASKFGCIKDGVFAEYFHVGQADSNLAHLPEDMSLINALMIPNMLATGFMAAENAEIPTGGSVAIFGTGPVGLSSLLAAKSLGAGRIISVGSRSKGVEVAEIYGASDVISYKDRPTDEQILEITDGEGVDSVIVAGGGSDVLIDAVCSAKPGSTISNINIFSTGDNIPIPRQAWGNGASNKTIVPGLLRGGRLIMERLTDLVKYDRVDLSLMATHIFHGFDKIEDAVLLSKEKPDDLIKSIVIIDENL